MTPESAAARLEGREGLRYTVDRPHPSIAIVDLRWPEGEEFAVVVAGERSLSVMAFDPNDAFHQEARVFVIPRPFGWSLDIQDEELLLLLWELTGSPR